LWSGNPTPGIRPQERFVQKLWAVLFGAVLLGCFVLTAAALTVFKEQWGLPSNIAADYGADVDYLFYLILAFTGFFYVLTEVILVYAMYKFASSEPTRRAAFTHGNHKLELAWTIIPAAILLYIAYAQISTWEMIKYQTHFPDPDQVIEVTAHQWEWRMRLSAEQNADTQAWQNAPKKEKEKQWAETPEFDDVHLANELHTWKDGKVKILLKTNDIIHSFFLPNLRLKQDALPGKTIPMWFKPNDWNAKFDPATGKTIYANANDKDTKHWEIACAELCGGGHYRMRGRLYVHETKADYEAWLKYTKEEQSSRRTSTTNPAATE
jgi:cytochrome c oxidase subunit II